MTIVLIDVIDQIQRMKFNVVIHERINYCRSIGHLFLSLDCYGENKSVVQKVKLRTRINARCKICI